MDVPAGEMAGALAVGIPFVTQFIKKTVVWFEGQLPTRLIPHMNIAIGVFLACAFSAYTGNPVDLSVLGLGIAGGAGATGIHNSVKRLGNPA